MRDRERGGNISPPLNSHNDLGKRVRKIQMQLVLTIL
jgi:hypothetical protein